MNLCHRQIHGEPIFGVDPTLLRFTSDESTLSIVRSSGAGFIHFWPEASRVDFHAPPEDAYEQYNSPGIKTAISTFSNKSRLNLMKKLSTIRRRAEFRIITLTYKNNVTDRKKYKRNLDAFFQRMRTDYPRISGIWKLEFQKRGAAHFHILFWGGWLDKDWLATTWDRIAGNEFGDRHSTSTSVEYPRHAKNATRYMLNYLSKGADEQHGEGAYPGRIWGTHNPGALPVSPTEGIYVDGDFVRATLDAWSERFDSGYRLNAVTIFLTESQVCWLSHLLTRAHSPPTPKPS